MSILTDAALQTRIDALQAQSAAQEAATLSYFGERAKKGDLSWDGLDADANRFMADKLVALEPIKAEFCHMLCRALGAKRVIEGPVDFVLMDIWTEMCRPAMELIGPHLRKGAIIVADNTAQFRHAYRHFFEFVDDPKNGLKTMTLPFDGGLEFVVKI